MGRQINLLWIFAQNVNNWTSLNLIGEEPVLQLSIPLSRIDQADTEGQCTDLICIAFHFLEWFPWTLRRVFVLIWDLHNPEFRKWKGFNEVWRWCRSVEEPRWWHREAAVPATVVAGQREIQKWNVSRKWQWRGRVPCGPDFHLDTNVCLCHIQIHYQSVKFSGSRRLPMPKGMKASQVRSEPSSLRKCSGWNPSGFCQYCPSLCTR